MNKVSIIVPYYKKINFFRKTINSALNQTYKKFEIIIIYDDEDLSELDFVKKIVKSDNRIKLIINKKNIGAGYSRNIGIKYATGKYICFLDADDIWKKKKIEYQLNFMKKNNCLISHTSYEIINQDKKIVSKRIAKTFENFEDLLFSCDIGLSTVMINKEILNDKVCFPSIKTKEDFVLWLRILKQKIKIVGFNKKLSFWIKSKNSLSSNTIQKLSDGFKVYNTYMRFGRTKSFLYLIILSINFLKKN